MVRDRFNTRRVVRLDRHHDPAEEHVAAQTRMDDQRVLALADLRPALLLWQRRLAETRSKPFSNCGVERF